MYDRLQEYVKVSPVHGNRGGSFLTMWSISGLKFGILQTISCWVRFLALEACGC